VPTTPNPKNGGNLVKITYRDETIILGQTGRFTGGVTQTRDTEPMPTAAGSRLIVGTSSGYAVIGLFSRRQTIT